MNDNQLQEMIELQRYKLQQQEQKHDESFKQCRELVNEILKELGTNVRLLGPLNQHNLNVVLREVKRQKEGVF